MLSTRVGRASGIFTGRSVPSADPGTVWLADLIEAAEVSAEPCDPAIVKVFGHRLEMRANVRPPIDPAFAQLSVGASERFGHVSPPVDSRLWCALHPFGSSIC
jgi:hypothetical protein